MTKFHSTVLLALSLCALHGPNAEAQRTRKRAEPAPTSFPAASGGESYSYSGSSRKFLEISSNQLVSGGLYGGGVNSALSVSTQSGSSVLFGLALSGDFNLKNEWQISVPLFLLISSSSTFILAAGPQYNFGDGPRLNQWFANLRPGFAVSGGETEFILNGTIGKRFEILPGVAYRPNFGINWNAGGGYVTFDLAPIALSIEI
jgi:hypothetical protein